MFNYIIKKAGAEINIPGGCGVGIKANEFGFELSFAREFGHVAIIDWMCTERVAVETSLHSLKC